MYAHHNFCYHYVTTNRLKLRNRIVSIFLLFFYALSTAHGAVPHSHDEGQNHHHHEEEHKEKGHHHHHHEDGQHLFSVTKGILHSVAHFIESLRHHHSETDDNIVLESTDLSQHLGCNSADISINSLPPTDSQTTEKGTPILEYAQVYLIHCPLRGPPSIV